MHSTQSRWAVGLTVVLALLFLQTTLFAQTDTSQIAGYVKDSSGAVVPNANITIRHEATGIERKAVTNETGYYVVPNLTPGLYTVSAEAAGFKRAQKTGNKLDPNIPLTVEMQLQVGAVEQTVEVVASAVTLQSESATLGKLVEGKQISDLQLNGRNPIFLAMLKPGVRRSSSLAGLSFGVDSGGFSINGSRSQDNLITYDGAVGIRTRSNGTSIGTADLDSVQEVQILTANYSAEYGRSAGGQIRIVTKTGGRDFHGSAYEYFRNSAMNANTWQRNKSASTNTPAPERFNQFGFNVGGPVYIPKINPNREKMFFFYSMEWLRRRTEQANTRTVPTAKMRQGDFSELLSTNPFFSGTRVVKDPLTGQPFQNNVIPQARWSPNGIGLLKVYPDPTPGFQQGASNWIGRAGVPQNHIKQTYAVDINASAMHSLRLRGTQYVLSDPNVFQSEFLHFTRIFDRPNQTGSVNWTWTVSPTLVSETIFSASRDQVFIDVDTSSGLYDRTKYGINFPYAFGGKDLPNKIPEVSISGFSRYTGSPYPSFSTGPIYNIANNTTKVFGNHTLKFGGLFERAGQNDYDQINISTVPGGTTNQNGGFQFTDSRTGGSGVAIADVVLGLYNTYAEVGPRSYTPYRGHMFEWFIQDGWKVTPKLKIDLGLRHSIIQPYYSLWRNMSVFAPEFYDPSKAIQVDSKGNPVAGTGEPLNGVIIPGEGWPSSAKGRVAAASDPANDKLFKGVSKSYSDVHYKDFQPRVGIAYALNPKTVLRAGAGKFITRLGVSDSIFLGGNAPLQPLASFATGNVDNPAGGASGAFPQSVNTQDRVFQNPTAYAWNFTVERELAFNTTVEVSYVGRRGLRGQRERNINQLPIGTLFLAENKGKNVNQLRPYQGFGPIRMTNNEANSMYNGLQLGINRRWSKGLAYGVAYTYSKSEDNGTGQRDILPNAFDASNIWGPSDNDTRHVAVVNVIYELPMFKDTSKLTGKILGGWELTAVTQFQTGSPFTAASSDDYAGVGSGSGSQIWNRNGDIKYTQQFSNSSSDSNYWFMPTNSDGSKIFTAPAQGTFTTQRNRNILYGPGFQNWNLGLFKKFALSERQRLTFRAEAFNWINHPNLDSGSSSFNRDPKSSQFGKVSIKSSERNIQLSLRYEF